MSIHFHLRSTHFPLEPKSNLLISKGFIWNQSTFNWFSLKTLNESKDKQGFQFISIYFQLLVLLGQKETQGQVRTSQVTALPKGSWIKKVFDVFFPQNFLSTIDYHMQTIILLRIRVTHGVLPWKIGLVLFFF